MQMNCRPILRLKLLFSLVIVIFHAILALWLSFGHVGNESPANCQAQASSDVRAFLHDAEDVLLNQKDKKRMLQLLRQFQQIAQRAQIDYMLSSNTLLGAYRHSNLIDYSDTLNVLINTDNKTALGRVFNNTVRVRKEEDAFQLFSPSLLERRSSRSVWPSIQVTFFERTDEILTVFEPLLSILLPENLFFPNIFLPVGDMLLPAPRCPLEYFFLVEKKASNFITHCCTGLFNHRLGTTRFRRARCISCWLLRSVFALTGWRRLNETHAQELILRPGLDEETPGRILSLPSCSSSDEEE